MIKARLGKTEVKEKAELLMRVCEEHQVILTKNERTKAINKAHEADS